MSTKENKNQNKKLPTGIAGLDAIFHGGIHTHDCEGRQKGIVMLARGQHGVNKIHLAMQICEGLYQSSGENGDNIDNNYNEALLFYFYNKERHNIKKEAIGIIDKEIEELKKKNFDSTEEIKGKENNELIKEWDRKKEKWGDSISNIEVGFTLLKKALNVNEVKNFLSNTREKQGLFSKILDLFLGIEGKDWERKLREAFYSNSSTNNDATPKVLFISINKDNNLIKNTYYDFYIQRLIRNIRVGRSEEEVELSLQTLRSMLWYKDETCSNKEWIKNEQYPEIYELPSITGKDPTTVGKDDAFRKHLTSGFIYYNSRTHGLHVRHQKGAEDTGDMLLCKLHIPDDHLVRVIGKDALNHENIASGLETFEKMMKALDDYKDKYPKEDDDHEENHQKKEKDIKDKKAKPEVDFIMIDGLSRLNKEELLQCPLNALSDKLRAKSTVAIITADEKLLPSEISTDIVLDMDILQSERTDHQYTALKVSKCLYQKNAYGWHRYKMRNAGIEVIPSIHLQMGQRFLMDDIVTDAVLPINEYPYPFWLNENKKIYEDEEISEAKEEYEKPDKDLLELVGHFEGRFLEKREVKEFLEEMLRKSKEKKHHVLFVNLDMNRIEVYNNYINNYFQVNNNRIDPKKIHLFNFQPGYIHTDEMLWAIDQQIRAIENVARRHIGTEKGRGLSTHYTHVRLIFGDLNYIHYAYPCLSAESLLLPALATYTKKHHMTNYVYATVNEGKHVEYTDLHKKEMETIMQMRRITKPFDEPLEKINVF